MHHYLNTILAFITQHAWLAYGAIFLVSFSESLALVGLLMPGTVIMFGVGAVVATGSLGLAPVLLLAMAGAAGVAEGGYGLLFAQLVQKQDITLLTLSWRFLTIYVGVVIGILVIYREMFQRGKVDRT